MVTGYLRKFFGGSARNLLLGRPENRVNASPPAPQGAWQLIVDSDGELVLNRPPTERDFLARRPVEYLYGGTIPKYDPKQGGALTDKIAASMDNAVRDFRNKQLLDRAVFLLSQTDDGRRLLEKAKAEKFTFVFDTQYMEKEGANGLFDLTEKQITLREGLTPEDVALTLKHELQHMDDMLKGAGHGAHDTIKSATIAQRGIEANARVSESVAALELYEGSADGPPNQFRSSVLLSKFYTKNPIMGQAAIDGLDKFRKGDIAGFARPVFTGYWKMHDTLDYYDDRLVRTLEEKTLNSPDIVFDPDTLNHSATRIHFKTRDNYIAYGRQLLERVASNDRWAENPDKIKPLLTIKGKSFLGAETDLSTPAMTALSDKAIKGLEKFIDRTKPFVPEVEETLRTNLFAPLRKPQTTIAAVISPIEGTGKEPKEFEPITHPYRTDGNKTTSGTPTHAITTKLFQQHWDQSANHITTLDRLSNSIWQYNYDYPGNIRGAMADMVDAGLRVPVAALPHEYILHLSRMAKATAETGRNAFSEQDLTLMQHWRDLSRHGYNPIYGTKVDDPKLTPQMLKDSAVAFHSECETHFNAYLKPYVDTIMPSRTAVAPDRALHA